MTKQEFLEKLAALLQDIPAEEREAALEFYRGYFDDAGEGREAEVIRELESPEKVAEQIKNGLKTGLGTDSYENAGSPYDKNTSRKITEAMRNSRKNPAAGGPSESSAWCCLSESRLAFRCWLRCLPWPCRPWSVWHFWLWLWLW